MSKKQSQRKERSKGLDVSAGKLMYDNVLIKPIFIDEIDGVKQPAQYEDKAEYGEVIAVGEGRILEDGNILPLKVKKGDKVYFEKYSALKVHNLGKDFVIIREEDIRIIL
jgi:chaperonin GroES